jgi:hypothetical protein
MECEINFTSHGDEASLSEVHVHIRCFAVWESERVAAGQRAATS